MQFSLLNPANNVAMIFPIAPESLQVDIGTKILNFEPISLGSIELPRGRKSIKFRMSGMFPGVNQSIPERESEISPEAIVEMLKGWSEPKGANGIKLRLIVTEADWNEPVFLVSFLPDYSGGNGDIKYTLELAEWRDFTVKEIKAKSTGKAVVREAKPKPKSHTVKKGDTLWDIARKMTVSGAKWKEMWALNKSKSRSKNPDLIFPGESFSVPPGWLK